MTKSQKRDRASNLLKLAISEKDFKKHFSLKIIVKGDSVKKILLKEKKYEKSS